MRRLWTTILAGALAMAAGGLAAQENTTLRAARQAYDNLDYDSAIVLTRRAMAGPRLAPDDLVAAYELLGFAAASVDSTAIALEAFRELIVLAPDREPDVVTVSPRITSLYRLALGQVLVVRKVRADSASFVAGQGAVPIRFEVSRSARASLRVVGGGLDAAVDSQSLAGAGLLTWRALRADSAPVPAGRYEIVIEATAGRDRHQASVALHVAHGARDTISHLGALPGYDPQPETEAPRRDWGPLGLAAIYTAIGAGLTLALPRSALGSGIPRELSIAAGAGVGLGVALSLRRPEARPVPAAILYNRLLRDILARRNAEIAQQNSALRRAVVLVITPVPVSR